MDLRGRLALVLELLLGAVGWGAVVWIVEHTYPDESRSLLAFYGALFVALSATSGLALYLLLRALPARVGSSGPSLSYLAHGMIFSALALFGLWLQSLRVLSPLYAVLLFGLYLFFEVALAVGNRRS